MSNSHRDEISRKQFVIKTSDWFQLALCVTLGLVSWYFFGQTYRAAIESLKLNLNPWYGVYLAPSTVVTGLLGGWLAFRRQKTLDGRKKTWFLAAACFVCVPTAILVLAFLSN
ncbi:MAG: hypothetical protein AAFV88_12590 [Planctomycetota bacterium]